MVTNSKGGDRSSSVSQRSEHTPFNDIQCQQFEQFIYKTVHINIPIYIS